MGNNLKTAVYGNQCFFFSPFATFEERQYNKLHSKYVVVSETCRATPLILIYHPSSPSSILIASVRKNENSKYLVQLSRGNLVSDREQRHPETLPSVCEVIHIMVSLWSRMVQGLAGYVLSASRTLSRVSKGSSALPAWSCQSEESALGQLTAPGIGNQIPQSGKAAWDT